MSKRTVTSSNPPPDERPLAQLRAVTLHRCIGRRPAGEPGLSATAVAEPVGTNLTEKLR